MSNRHAILSAVVVAVMAIHVNAIATDNPGASRAVDGICSGNGIIDGHCHLYVSYNPKKNTLLPQENYDDAARAAIETMDELGIKISIVMPPPFTTGQSGIYDYDAFISAIKGHPGRFAFLGGGGLLNPMIQEHSGKTEISREIMDSFTKKAEKILSDGASGFGEIAFEHLSFRENHPYEHASPDSPLMLLLADIAARHGVPIDIHMEAVPEDMALPVRGKIKAGPNPKELKENIKAFGRLLSYNPKARIIWAHAGWCNTGKRTVELMDGLLERHPNLYMSIKISPESIPEMRPFSSPGEIREEWLKLMKKYPDRFFVGSDEFYQSAWASERRPIARNQILGKFIENLPPEIREKVGCENASRLFRLGENIPAYKKPGPEPNKGNQ